MTAESCLATGICSRHDCCRTHHVAGVLHAAASSPAGRIPGCQRLSGSTRGTSSAANRSSCTTSIQQTCCPCCKTCDCCPKGSSCQCCHTGCGSNPCSWKQHSRCRRSLSLGDGIHPPASCEGNASPDQSVQILHMMNPSLHVDQPGVFSTNTSHIASSLMCWLSCTARQWTA